MGSDMNGVKVGICCEFGKVTSEETGSGKRTSGSGKGAGKFVGGSSPASIDIFV